LLGVPPPRPSSEIQARFRGPPCLTASRPPRSGLPSINRLDVGYRPARTPPFARPRRASVAQLGPPSCTPVDAPKGRAREPVDFITACQPETRAPRSTSTVGSPREVQQTCRPWPASSIVVTSLPREKKGRRLSPVVVSTRPARAPRREPRSNLAGPAASELCSCASTAPVHGGCGKGGGGGACRSVGGASSSRVDIQPTPADA